MPLDHSRLQNVREHGGGRVIAQCPACAQSGGDRKREHLIVYPDGKYGCVANPDDKQHRKDIFRIAGTQSGTAQAGHGRKLQLRIPRPERVGADGRSRIVRTVVLHSMQEGKNK